MNEPTKEDRNRVNGYGCSPWEDVCLKHDQPLICQHGCEEAKPHKEFKDWENSVEVTRDGDGRFIIVSVLARYEDGHELSERAGTIAREIVARYAS